LERVNYTTIQKTYETAIDDAICGRKPADAYRSILQALLGFRLVCNHGKVPLNVPSSGGRPEGHPIPLLHGGTSSCAYCGIEAAAEGFTERFQNAGLLACSHIVCDGCLEIYLEDLESTKAGVEIVCPNCSVTEKSHSHLPPEELSQKEEIVSTKLERLLEDVELHRHTDKW
jgi:SWI/SNF-related matrix-associated actin-dependent regulator of chromatin subfamily A3